MKVHHILEQWEQLFCKEKVTSKSDTGTVVTRWFFVLRNKKFRNVTHRPQGVTHLTIEMRDKENGLLFLLRLTNLTFEMRSHSQQELRANLGKR